MEMEINDADSIVIFSSPSPKPFICRVHRDRINISHSNESSVDCGDYDGVKLKLLYFPFSLKHFFLTTVAPLMSPLIGRLVLPQP